MTTPYADAGRRSTSLGNDSDPDNDPLTVTAATLADPASGTLAQDAGDGVWTFTPAPGFSGDAVINYTITDQDGATDSAIHTVTVAERAAGAGRSDAGRAGHAGDRSGRPGQPAGAGHRRRAADAAAAADYFTDPNTGDVLTITPDMTGVPAWLTYDPLTQTFSGTPPVDKWRRYRHPGHRR